MNFRSASLLFFISVAVAGAMVYLHFISQWWMTIPVLIYLWLIIYGSANIQSGFFGDAAFHGDETKKEIAITFDDGPDIHYTPEVLTVLKEFNVPATFFVIGKKIPGNEALLEKINEYGHTIGNHSFSHSYFIDFKSKSGFMDELNKTADLIYWAIGKRVKFFRPPYGVTTPNLAKASKALDYRLIGWNIRSLDTTNDSDEKIIERVNQQLKPGAIILLHDTSEKTGRVLKQILIFAMQNGYQCVSLERLLNLKAYA